LLACSHVAQTAADARRGRSKDARFNPFFRLLLGPALDAGIRVTTGFQSQSCEMLLFCVMKHDAMVLEISVVSLFFKAQAVLQHDRKFLNNQLAHSLHLGKA
jgi:hypothetical protein